MTVSGPQRTYCKVNASEVERSISFINNIAYTNERVLLWRAYGVGSGKFLPKRSFCQQSSSLLPQLNKNTDNAISQVSFQTIKARRGAKKKTTTTVTTELAKASASLC